MAITQITASPTGNAQVSSGFAGNPVWNGGVQNVQVNIPVGQGTTWVVWKVQIPGLTPGEPFNGIRVEGTNDFVVGGGGGGILRNAQAYADIYNTLNGFLNQVGSGVGIATPGSGTGVPINAVVERPGFTSTDLINGTFFFGFAVNTDSQDIGLGDGFFRTSALNWTIYTGTDLPVPPPTQATGYLTNPASNVNPGVLAPGKFQGIQYTTTSGTGAFINAQWTSPHVGITFDGNGSGVYNQVVTGGTVNCGLISVASTVPPGTYLIGCQVTGFDGPSSVSLGTQVVVAFPSTGGWFFEF